MNIGQTVYTVNAKTNEVDTWTYSGKIEHKREYRVILTNGKKQGAFPPRCVYTSYERALEIAKK